MSGVERLGSRLHYPSGLPAAQRVLLAMLPGAGIAAEDFAVRGLVAAAQHGMPGLEVIALRPDLELYLEGTLAPVLHEGIIAPARAAGIQRIWLLGVSLGGMGALLHASEYPDCVEGLVLLAPFLGTAGTIAELTRAGRFDHWAAEASAATAPERQLLVWLQSHLRSGAKMPRLFLGHGKHDRFAAGHRLLAAQLPPSQVVQVDGGHDWAAWTEAWQAILARKPFG